MTTHIHDTAQFQLQFFLQYLVCGDDEGCLAVGKHVGEALVRIFQIEWQVSSPCFMNTEHADREIDTSLNHDTNEVLLTYTHVNKLVGYEIGLVVKLGVCQLTSIIIYSQILDRQQSSYSSIIGNNMNVIMRTLTVITIILATVLLGESLSVPGAIGIVLIGVGTMLMIEKKDVETMSGRNSSWLLFAIGSAVFAALTSILGKIGIEGVESNLGTAIRTIVVLGMSWLMVFVMKKQTQVREVKRRDAGFLVLSGLATGASWLCFFKALQDGPASIVVPIDKLSILVTILFSFIVFRETLNSKSAAGLIGIVAGTMMLLI